MKRILVVWLLVFFQSLCATVVQAQDVVKGFTFATIAGKTLDYRSLKGIPMVVNIGAHWCPPCKKEAPDLQKAYLSYKNRGVLFLGVFVGSKEEEIRKFAETYRITFPVGKENGIAEALGVKGIPTTVFIARDGRIVKRYVGTIDSAELVSDIETMLR